LRSALDYTARNLFIRYGASNKNPNIYFPYISTIDMTRQEYDEKKLFNRVLPGVEATRPDVRDFILLLSEYEKGTRWFFDFMQITNTNKHVKLVRQEVREDVTLDMPSNEGVGISFRAHSISFGSTGGLATDVGRISGPFDAKPGESIPMVEGGSITPERIRYLSIEGHLSAGEAKEFAERCCVVISDVVRRLVSDPPCTV
jgi:hypothetical protein